MDEIQIALAIRDILVKNMSNNNPLSILLNVKLNIEPETQDKSPNILLECRDGLLFILTIKEDL